MNAVLLVIAAGLMCLLVVSVIRQRQIAAAVKEADSARNTPEAHAQHDRAMSRRAEVRAAHADRKEEESRTEAI